MSVFRMLIWALVSPAKCPVRVLCCPSPFGNPVVKRTPPFTNVDVVCQIFGIERCNFKLLVQFRKD